MVRLLLGLVSGDLLLVLHNLFFILLGGLGLLLLGILLIISGLFLSVFLLLFGGALFFVLLLCLHGLTGHAEGLLGGGSFLIISLLGSSFVFRGRF